MRKILAALIVLIPGVAYADHYNLSRTNPQAYYISGSGVVAGDLYMNGNDITCLDDIYCLDPTSDVAAKHMSIKAQDAYPQASVNTSGGNLVLLPGSGTIQITIDNYANCTGDYVRWYTNIPPATGGFTTFTEGAGAPYGWTAATSNDVTAANLAATITAISGLEATSVGAVVYVTSETDSFVVNATEGDATCTTIAQGTPGAVLLPETANIGWGDGGEYITGSNNTSTLNLYASGGIKMYVGSSIVGYYVPFGFAAGTLFKSTGGNGTLVKTNYAGTAGYCENFTTDGHLKLYDRTCSAAADLTVDTVTVTEHYHHEHIQIGAAILGPTAPDLKTIGVARGYGFDADADSVHFSWEVPAHWTDAGDIYIHIHWASESGTPIPDTKKVKWDVHYMSLEPTEDVDGGGTAANVATATYTQSGGASIDSEYIETVITIDYDDLTWPVDPEDLIVIQLDRDVTGEAGDTYGADAVILNVDFVYPTTNP